jgi:hypothetical protein
MRMSLRASNDVQEIELGPQFKQVGRRQSLPGVFLPRQFRQLFPGKGRNSGTKPRFSPSFFFLIDRESGLPFDFAVKNSSKSGNFAKTPEP